VTRAIVAEFGPQLSPEALTAAKAAAAIMGMNNIFNSRGFPEVADTKIAVMCYRSVIWSVARVSN
jgi:hypothetical protein